MLCRTALVSSANSPIFRPDAHSPCPNRPPGLAARLARSPWPAGAGRRRRRAGRVRPGPGRRNRSSRTNRRITPSRTSPDVFASGRFNDPAWLDYPAFDLPPLPKYLIGAALWVGGYKTPARPRRGPGTRNTLARFDPPGALAVARVPMVIVGALGLRGRLTGSASSSGGRAVGLLAALLLIANPLYRLHARRAMSDVPCEAFMLLGAVLRAPGLAPSALGPVAVGGGSRRSSRGCARGWPCSRSSAGCSP